MSSGLWGIHDRDADSILNGHAHRYERFAPTTPGGRRSADGIRQIVAGAGGEITHADAPDLQVAKTGPVGDIRLGLRADSYAWRFVPVVGRTSTDSGTTNCHQAVPTGYSP